MKLTNGAVFLIIAMMLLVGLLVFVLVNGKITGKVIDNSRSGESWLNDNCKCLEKERLTCYYDGFELRNDKYCWKDNTFTNPLKKCSLYDCNGENVTLN